MEKGTAAAHRWWLCASLIIWMALPRVSAGSSEDGYTVYSGTAVDLHSLRFIYGERHILRHRDGRVAERVVLYTCRDGSAFARKSVQYVDPLAPDFLLEDASTGLREGIRSVGPARSVFFQAGGSPAEKAAPLPQVSGLVADAGFDEFIRSNWLPLVHEQPLMLHFLVPSRLKETAFVVRHLRSDSTDGLAAEVFRLQLAGPLSWLLPSIDVFYGASDHLLKRYDGLSDLRDAAGGNIRAQIMFPAHDRQPGDAATLAAARQARLAPCS